MYYSLITWTNPSNPLVGFNGIASKDSKLSFKLNNMYGNHHLSVEYVDDNNKSEIKKIWTLESLKTELHGKWIQCQIAFSVNLGYETKHGENGVKAFLLKLRISSVDENGPQSKSKMFDDAVNNIPFSPSRYVQAAAVNIDSDNEEDDDNRDSALMNMKTQPFSLAHLAPKKTGFNFDDDD